MSKQDQVFAKLARRYTKAYGESLLAENRELRRRQVNLSQADQAVRRLLTQRSRRIFYLIGGLAAACLVLMVTRPMKKDLFPDLKTKELILLSFSLPENLTVKESMVDQGQSVYLLADRLQDDMVLMIEKQDAQVKAADTAKMMMVEINGHQVYVRSDAAYQQLICYQGDLVYRMTCRYDINTLLPVAEKIFSDEL